MLAPQYRHPKLRSSAGDEGCSRRRDAHALSRFCQGGRHSHLRKAPAHNKGSAEEGWGAALFFDEFEKGIHIYAWTAFLNVTHVWLSSSCRSFQDKRIYNVAVYQFLWEEKMFPRTWLRELCGSDPPSRPSPCKSFFKSPLAPQKYIKLTSYYERVRLLSLCNSELRYI